MNLIGKKKGKLTVLEWSTEHGRKIRGGLWKSECECGNIRFIGTHTFNTTDDPSCRECSRKKPRVSKEHKTYRHVFNQYKSNSRNRKGKQISKKFELTFEQVIDLITNNCYYCGEPPSTINKKYNEVPYNGIDRIDSDIGYCISNVRSCCTTCNMMKGSLKEEAFLNKIKQIEENLK